MTFNVIRDLRNTPIISNMTASITTLLGKMGKKSSAGADSIVEEPADERTEVTVNQALKLTSFDVWALGITVVIGGQYFSWNAGLVAGFGSFLICTFLIGTAYICLCFCNAEVTSSLPFAGGAYGMARVSLGLYAGFIIGCVEISEYIVYVTEASIVLGKMISIIADVSEDYIPVWSLLFLIISCWIQIQGGRVFWRSITFLAIVSIVILLFYNFGSLHFSVNIANATSPLLHGGNTEDGYFIGGFSKFLTVLPLVGQSECQQRAQKTFYTMINIVNLIFNYLFTLSRFTLKSCSLNYTTLAAWWYVGVETLNLATVFVEEPKVTIVRGSIACVLTLFLTSMFTLWVSSTLPREDSILAESLSPLSYGLKQILSTTSEMALILSIPATFATGFGFIYGYGRVILSMARSDLFPSILSRTYGKAKTPYIAILAGSFLSYILVIVIHFLPEIEVYLFNVTIVAAFTAYNSQFIGFLSLRFRFPNQERLFTSPLGIYGALYGISVFTLATISVIGFQNDGSTAFIIFIMIIVICSIYYFAYAKKRQGFSEEEKFIFVLQIVKYNERSREEARTGSGRKKQVKQNPNSEFHSYIKKGGSLIGNSIRNSFVTGMGSSGMFSRSSSRKIRPGSSRSQSNFPSAKGVYLSQKDSSIRNDNGEIFLKNDNGDEKNDRKVDDDYMKEAELLESQQKENFRRSSENFTSEQEF